MSGTDQASQSFDQKKGVESAPKSLGATKTSGVAADKTSGKTFVTVLDKPRGLFGKGVTDTLITGAAGLVASVSLVYLIRKALSLFQRKRGTKGREQRGRRHIRDWNAYGH
jgi:hypothetical protein